jgi:hypothetical protein
LEKAGFIKINDEILLPVAQRYKLLISLKGGGRNEFYFVYALTNEIKSLQNLYFALTGEELPITL